LVLACRAACRRAFASRAGGGLPLFARAAFARHDRLAGGFLIGRDLRLPGMPAAARERAGHDRAATAQQVVAQRCALPAQPEPTAGRDLGIEIDDRAPGQDESAARSQ
jgi:hypothetical protein